MPDQRLLLNEKEYVEEPFLRQLEGLGWAILRAGEAGKGDPIITEREGFNEVIIERRLKAALLRVNPWLDEDQVAPVIRELDASTVLGGLTERNRHVFDKLLERASAENRGTGRAESVDFIDFENQENNDFLAVSQFKVNIPGTEKHIIPDIVLFVNGLPLGVIECKSAYLADPIGEAYTQLMRYQNRRGDEKEGNEKLFWYNQILVATSRQKCKYSSVTGELEHLIEWKDPYPAKLTDIDAESSGVVTSQQIFVRGVLEKENFLKIIRSCILFQASDKGRLIKVLPRYQQYRTVCKIIERLKSDNPFLNKGGIIWHTQGSGKSLTMMMLVRMMYRDGELKKYKIAFITDRTDLQTQLSETAESIGYELKVAAKISRLKELLRTDTPDLVMGMIHKFQEHEFEREFPVLNESDKILVIIDEAHRSQYKFLGANLEKSLPNSTRLAFTGTPIDKTELTFGDYIDEYSIKQAVDDEVTVKIIYEGRTHGAEITDTEAMNAKFEDVFADASNETRRQVSGFATWRAYLEAEATIKSKAEDMLRHYLAQIFPNGFKAQVVAVSREAAIRYKRAFDALLQDVSWLDGYLSELKRSTDFDLDGQKLADLKVEVVISGTANDPPDMHPYTDDSKHEMTIKSFKLPFGKEGEGGIRGDVGIIVVQSMLLTGFDAPVEQVLYLDNVIKEHNLLQAIARVNRVDKNKGCGFVVDYVGVARHLRDALKNFEDRDVEEMLQVVRDRSHELDELAHAKAALDGFLDQYGIANPDDLDACIDVLADDEARNDFLALYRKLTTAMDTALPSPEALKYLADYRKYTFISQTARNRYRDEKFSIRDASAKIREIVEEYLVSKGVDPKIPPIPIFDPRFASRLSEVETPRAKAEELKSAISEYINKHIEEDPELFERFGERLEKLLQEYQQNWNKLAMELEAMLEELRQGREGEENFGLDKKREMPFLGLLKKDVFGVRDIGELSQGQIDMLVQTTKDILENIQREIGLVDFWNNQPAQRRLKSHITSRLLEAFRGDNKVLANRNLLGQKILELAYHIYGNHQTA